MYLDLGLIKHPQRLDWPRSCALEVQVPTSDSEKGILRFIYTISIMKAYENVVENQRKKP